jgi:hypothetical protein
MSKILNLQLQNILQLLAYHQPFFFKENYLFLINNFNLYYIIFTILQQIPYFY